MSRKTRASYLPGVLWRALCVALLLLLVGCCALPSDYPRDPNTGSPAPPQLFIASTLGNSVVSYRNPSTVHGNVVPDTFLLGASTDLAATRDVAVNPAGQLLAANAGNQTITTYNNASTADDNLAPSGKLEGAATLLDSPISLAIIPAQDQLFVCDDFNSRILAYDISAGTLTGNQAPTRTITSGAAMNSPRGISFGAADDLYVANQGGSNVLVFANASLLDGVVVPARVITSAAFGDLYGVFVDGSDNLYVVNTGGTVNIFANAASLMGLEIPDGTLTVAGASALSAIVVGSDGVGYIADPIGNSVYSYDNIGTLNGSLAPTRTIHGVDTKMSEPSGLYLVE